MSLFVRLLPCIKTMPKRGNSYSRFTRMGKRLMRTLSIYCTGQFSAISNSSMFKKMFINPMLELPNSRNMITMAMGQSLLKSLRVCCSMTITVVSGCKYLVSRRRSNRSHYRSQ